MASPSSEAVTIVRNVAALRANVAAARAKGARIAFVPTMGALHEGHLALVHAARERAAHIVVSVFVNPTQFAPHEDFAAYPRAEADDAAKLARTGAVTLFAPERAAMYPDGDATTVSVAGPARGLETDFRPHFFAGVATVVTKLLIQAAPDVALFGEKDYQQLLVIRRLVADLSLPVEIVGVPTVREDDGLARSSRNVYLSPKERAAAPALHRALLGVAAAARDGRPIQPAIEAAKRDVIAAGFTSVDYIALRDAATLEPIERLAAPGRVLGAARLDTTRLIDNVAALP